MYAFMNYSNTLPTTCLSILAYTSCLSLFSTTPLLLLEEDPSSPTVVQAPVVLLRDDLSSLVRTWAVDGRWNIVGTAPGFNLLLFFIPN